MQEAVLITNLAAEATSRHVKEVIVKALSVDLRLEVVDTAAPGHATVPASEAARSGYEIVVAFGGDGTMNEVANGLVGSDTRLAVLPGGTTNVVCRNLGLPADIVAAMGQLLNRLRDQRSRRISVGRAEGRCFLVSCGVGLEPATADRPRRAGRGFSGRSPLESVLQAARDGRGTQPLIHLSADDVAEDVVVAVISCMPQHAGAKGRLAARPPAASAPTAEPPAGLDVLGVRRPASGHVLRLAWPVLNGGSDQRSTHVVHLQDLGSLHLRSSGPSFPIHLDGEFVHERTEVEVELIRDGLAVLV